MSRRRSVLAGASALAVASSLLAGCTFQGGDPEKAAGKLAEALESRDVSGVEWAPRTRSAAVSTTTEVFQALGDRRPTVNVGKVFEDGNGKGTAELAYTWDLGPREDDAWNYTTTADLELDGDTWRPVFNPGLLAPGLVAGERLSVRREQPVRAPVKAGDTNVVSQTKVVRIGIDKSRLDDPTRADGPASALAQLVRIDPKTYVARTLAAGPKAFVEAITLRLDDPLNPSRPQLARIQGARALGDELPLAVTRTFARPLLGSVGEATAELVDSSGGRVAAGDLTGLSGLQRRYDAALAGSAGVRVDAITEDPNAGRELFAVEAVQGTPLVLTMDAQRQLRAEALLAKIATPAALVAVQPSTGDVLVAASGPGGNGASTALVSQYPPGSTFKIVTALALLRAGLTPQSEVACAETITVDGREFRNYSDFPTSRLGTMTLTDAIAYSCNTALIAQAAKVDQAAMAQAAATLGVTTPIPEFGAPAAVGSVPATATGATDHAASMIGQGRVQASVLAMARMAATVAAGKAVTPRLVVSPEPGEANDADPTESSTASPTSVPATPLTAAEAGALRGMMRAVVERGTASQLASLGGGIGAKTGTAEYGTATPPATHGWMVVTRGDLAVAVFVADGKSGATAAGPVVRSFLAGEG